MAKIYKTNGSIVDVEPKNGTDFKWEELHDIVGGYIEIIQLDSNQIMVVNEEGKLYNLPFNAMATSLYHKEVPQAKDDFVVGDVLVCYQDEIE